MTEREFWNQVFTRVRRNGKVDMVESHWLAPYLPLFRGQEVVRVLEIGCGSGMDTAFLAQAGFTVTATDFSMSALSLVRDRLPEVTLLLHDTRDPFPFPEASFDLVLASLSLHYFSEETTARIVREIERLLRPRGLFLYRLNSTLDEMAGQGEVISPNFYKQSGIERRYFTLSDCRTLCRDFEEIMLEEKQVEAYGKTKALCEGLVRKKSVR